MGAARSIKRAKKRNENEEVGERRELPFSLHCVVPENIHTPTTEGNKTRKNLFVHANMGSNNVKDVFS